MKQTNPEAIKTQNTEAVNLREAVDQGRFMVQKAELEAVDAQQAERQLELELREAQVAHDQKKESEERGQETKEKISEVSGGLG